MAKISISRVLEERRRVRIFTVLASLIVIVLLFEGLILKNPKSSMAASFSEADGKITAQGDYFIDQNGKIFSLNPTDSREFYSEKGDVTNKDLAIGANSNITFAGGQVSLNSLNVGNGSTLYHLGASTKANSVSVAQDHFGAIIEGWIKTTSVNKATFRSEDGSRVYLDTGGAPFTGTTALSGSGVYTYFSNLNVNTWYHFKAYYIGVTNPDFFQIYIQGDYSIKSNQFPITNINADGYAYDQETNSNVGIAGSEGQVYVTYFAPDRRMDEASNRACDNVSGYLANLNNPLSGISSCFNAKNIQSTKIKRSLFGENPGDIDQCCVSWHIGDRYNPETYCRRYDQTCLDALTQIVYLGLSFDGGSEWRRDTTYDVNYTRGINLKVSGDFTLGQGAKIDVSGRGYLGGFSYASGDNGFGPGAGTSRGSAGGSRGDSPGSGAGHGGRGGLTKDDSNNVSWGGAAYDSIYDPSDMGSGGGAGHAADGFAYTGGAGGGIIKITAGSITIANNAVGSINADGSAAFNWNNNWSKSAGGAGGTINLNSIGNFNIGATGNIITARGGRGGTEGSETPGDGGGGRVSVKASQFTGAGIEQLVKGDEECPSIGTFFYMMDNMMTCASGEPIINVYPPRISKFGLGGASSDGNPWNDKIGGERGTVYVGGGSGGNTIKKKLIPVSRNGQGNTTFNPYALQTDDVITVYIELSNLVTGNTTTVKDEILHTPGLNVAERKRCVPNGVWNIVPTTADPLNADTLEWNIGPGDGSIITYQCKVK